MVGKAKQVKSIQALGHLSVSSSPYHATPPAESMECTPSSPRSYSGSSSVDEPIEPVETKKFARKIRRMLQREKEMTRLTEFSLSPTLHGDRHPLARIPYRQGLFPRPDLEDPPTTLEAEMLRLGIDRSSALSSPSSEGALSKLPTSAAIAIGKRRGSLTGSPSHTTNFTRRNSDSSNFILQGSFSPPALSLASALHPPDLRRGCTSLDSSFPTPDFRDASASAPLRVGVDVSRPPSSPRVDADGFLSPNLVKLDFELPRSPSLAPPPPRLPGLAALPRLSLVSSTDSADGSPPDMAGGPGAAGGEGYAHIYSVTGSAYFNFFDDPASRVRRSESTTSLASGNASPISNSGESFGPNGMLLDQHSPINNFAASYDGLFDGTRAPQNSNDEASDASATGMDTVVWQRNTLNMPIAS